ncbi:hypothetical protein DICPUDRAFT_87864 [Dictyostelium purpureum]|uniref:GH84 domain-containing protein n=1 Tax=Dictyostelium purpureum TaxID=5786 RepID=F0ZKV7_DICPU|nr:uncharacterized protein DICPUDRAFT_87864 [Dictyostelium purpureum]EGC35427.1 hypothetical protein DICPUDRAFT_87864 [Dictyostelium purpureum]|eukprot:XP_003288040.1 hypothetical protein DICPUDRAFT_87864 [Dictyostelium purpureum]
MTEPLTYEIIEKWTIEKMDKMLGCDSNELAKYVLSLETNSEIQSYLEELLGTTKKVQSFIEQLIKKINSLPRRVNKFQKIVQPSNQTNNIKKKQQQVSVSQQPKDQKVKQKITSFSEIEIQMKPGEPCECQATRHKLITNCLNCGKIICEQEGKGPCKFCQTPLFTNPASLSIQQQQLSDKHLNSAIEYKDRILGYQNTHAKRTIVFDDQEDYFSNSSNKWLTEEERKKVAQQELDYKKKKDELKNKTRISIDFLGRRIVSEPIRPNEIEVEKISFSTGNSNNKKEESSSLADYKMKNKDKDTQYDIKNQVKYIDDSGVKQGSKRSEEAIIKLGNDDIITRQYYGVEEDIVVYNSKETKSNPLRFRGIMEGLWLPKLKEYTKYINSLYENNCNYFIISPQNYTTQDFQNILDHKVQPKLPNQIQDFLKKLLVAIKTASLQNNNGNDNNTKSLQLNIAILIPKEFEFSLEENQNQMINIIKMYMDSVNIKSFTLVLPSGFNDSFTLPICAPNSTKSEVNNSKTYSQTQTMFLNKLHAHFKNTVEIIVCPSIFELNINPGNAPPSRQQIEYWLEMNRATPSKYPLLFTTLNGSLQNSTLTKIKNIFDKRDLICIEKYPYKNNSYGTQSSTSLPIEWDPYQCSFDDHKSYLAGVIASPFNAEFYLDDFTSEITLSTFIHYLKSPFTYQSELTLRATLVQFTDNNEDIADDLATLILALSNGIFNQIHNAVESLKQEKQLHQQQYPNEPYIKPEVDPREKLFFNDLIDRSNRILEFYKTILQNNDSFINQINLIKITLLNYTE